MIWSAIGGALGEAVSKVGSGIKDVVSAFKADPTTVEKHIAALEQAYVELEKSSQAQINETMRAEAQSQHWAQWLWRPTIGFTFAGVLINNYILLPYMQGFGIVPIDIPMHVWTAMLVILGAAAAGRSWEKVSNHPR